MPHPRRLWPSAVQLWEPEILHNLSSVVPTCWVYKCKLWRRDDTSMIWCSILYINFVGNAWTLPAVQFALCSLDQPLALSISYGLTVIQCDAQNAIRQILITANNYLPYPAVVWYPVSCTSHQESNSGVRGLIYALTDLSVILYKSETIAGFHIFRHFNQISNTRWTFEAGGNPSYM